MASGGNCIRTYKPEIKKGSYNTVILNVKTTTADNLLFYLGSNRFVSLSLFYKCFTIKAGSWHLWKMEVKRLVMSHNELGRVGRVPGFMPLLHCWAAISMLSSVMPAATAFAAALAQQATTKYSCYWCFFNQWWFPPPMGSLDSSGDSSLCKRNPLKSEASWLSTWQINHPVPT